MDIYSYSKSRDIFERALKTIPAGIYGHLGPVNGCFTPIGAYPLFSSKAKGAYFWDVDGNRFIDYMCAYGPTILGYGDEDIEEAVRKQAEKGNCVTCPSDLMVECAETIVNTVEMADWTFFAKNGGDVTSLALLVAKAATGRKKSILFKGGYHGVAPWTQKLGAPGIVEEDVANNIYVKWNDYDSIERIVKEKHEEIACIMSSPYHHPIFADSEMPQKDFWAKIRKLCDDYGILLIIDDVRCGFRLDMKGSDYYFGFKADLVCFCKALGNGWNFSALCGQEKYRDAISALMYTGSYWLSAVPFAAGIATLNKLKKINGPKIMLEKGDKLTKGLQSIAKDNGFNLIVSGHPSMWYMRHSEDDSMLFHQKWVAECVKRGVFFTNHHNLFINCALSDEDIEYTFNVAHEAYKALKNN